MHSCKTCLKSKDYFIYILFSKGNSLTLEIQSKNQILLKNFDQMILDQNFKEKFKNKFVYAFGEIIFIVIGILVALYIDNWNANIQYKKAIDINFQRVYSELEKNIVETKETINGLYLKDSLIYKVMNDSLKSKEYYNNTYLSFLILYFYNLDLEDKAFQNLNQLNVSENVYKEELLKSLKELYALNRGIKENNDRMSAFVYEESLPLIAKNTKSFGDLTYKSIIKEDVVRFYIESPLYKSIVSQYAIIALKNQLRYDQIFLRKAIKVYQEIGQEYNLKIDKKLFADKSATKFIGTYVNSKYQDTLNVKIVRDSLFLGRQKSQKLVFYQENHYFAGDENGSYFVTFLRNEKLPITYSMKICILNNKVEYQKIR